MLLCFMHAPLSAHGSQEKNVRFGTNVENSQVQVRFLYGHRIIYVCPCTQRMASAEVMKMVHVWMETSREYSNNAFLNNHRRYSISWFLALGGYHGTCLSTLRCEKYLQQQPQHASSNKGTLYIILCFIGNVKKPRTSLSIITSSLMLLMRTIKINSGHHEKCCTLK